jgi:hypothetical protein
MSRTPVPEAAVHEDGGTPARKNYVRAKAICNWDVSAEAKTSPMKRSPQ